MNASRERHSLFGAANIGKERIAAQEKNLFFCPGWTEDFDDCRLVDPYQVLDHVLWQIVDIADLQGPLR
jgi:hypothetical protein